MSIGRSDSQLRAAPVMIRTSMSDWFWSYGFADVRENVLIGAFPLDAGDVKMIADLGVREILNLAEDEEYPPGRREEVIAALAAAQIPETRIRFVDHGALPPEQLEQAVQTVVGWLQSGRRSYVHCRAGWQRSAAIAAGVIAVNDALEIEEALEIVRSRKPSAVPLEHQHHDLVRWWRERA